MSPHRPDPERDDAFDRLRGADPAAGLEPDPASLDAVVRQRVGLPQDELGSARARAAARAGARAGAGRRPGRWLAVAAVAAGTLVVGSVGGYALGSRGDDRSGGAAAAAISLGAGTGAAESSALGADAARTAGSAAGSAAADAPAVASDRASSTSLFPWFGGHTVFTASGLSDESGRAAAYAYDPAQAFSAGTAARVASSLGLEGEPRLEGGAWVVGPQDAVNASLQLQPDGVTSVSYYDPSLDPFGCQQPLATPEAAVEGADGGVSEPGRDELDAPPCPPREPNPAPQGDAAVARAREALTGAGVDADRYEYEASESGTPDAAYVTAYEVVDGQRTGTVWSLTLVGDAVQSLYGALAPLVPLGDYDVVSETEAVARLADPRFGMSGGGVMAAAGSVADDTAAGTTLAGPAPDAAPQTPTDPTPPPAVTPGSALGWPVVEVTLTRARLGLAQQTLPSGATVLLPAYELSADDGSAWSVVAVADSGLDFSAGR
jgi:hypothetical protein